MLIKLHHLLFLFPPFPSKIFLLNISLFLIMLRQDKASSIVCTATTCRENRLQVCNESLHPMNFCIQNLSVSLLWCCRKAAAPALEQRSCNGRCSRSCMLQSSRLLMLLPPGGKLNRPLQNCKRTRKRLLANLKPSRYSSRGWQSQNWEEGGGTPQPLASVLNELTLTLHMQERSA